MPSLVTVDYDKLPTVVERVGGEHSYSTMFIDGDVPSVKEIPFGHCATCGKSFQSRIALRTHLLRTHNKESEKKCKVCGEEFDSKQSLLFHMRNKHNELKFQCEQCGKRFRLAASLRKHGRNHSDVRNFMCDLCGASFKTSTNLRTHERGVHRHESLVSSAVFPCQYCPKTLRSRYMFEAHVRNHEQPFKYKCEYCEKQFSSQHGLSIHTSVCHDNPAVWCKVCKKMCDNETKCAHLCSAEQRMKSKRLDANMGLASSNQCGGCGMKFESVMDRDAHLGQSSGDTYFCPECNSLHENKCSLTHHVRTAYGSKYLYVCNLCPSFYQTKGGLILHNKKYHSHQEMKHECNFCDRKFHFRTDLVGHERMHTGEKPYRCDDCGKTFRMSTALAAHRGIHTNKRPHVCKVCGKASRLPYHLRVHMRTHTGEKPYVCNICGRAFSQQGDRNKHMKTHKSGAETLNPVAEVMLEPDRFIQIPLE